MTEGEERLGSFLVEPAIPDGGALVVAHVERLVFGQSFPSDRRVRELIDRSGKGDGQVAGGIAVDDVCRQVGISEQTFYRWKKHYGGMLPSEARELKQLREQNTKLKRLAVELSFDKVTLQDVVQKSSEARQAAGSRGLLDGAL